MAEEVDLKTRIYAEFMDDYAILRMRNGENRFNNETVDRITEVLDEIDRNKDVKFLISIGEGKFYSNGLDLMRLQSDYQNHARIADFYVKFNQMLIKLMTFPVPTFAALNGHTYAGGLFLALVHDYRIMRTKQGWICLPEIRLKMPFPIGLRAILRMKIANPRIAIDAIIMGKKFTAEQALAAGLVDKICSMEDLLSTVVQYGRSIVNGEDYDRKHMTLLKANHYENVIREIKEDIKTFSSKL